VLILGSGALKISEAGEFDYSGSQAGLVTLRRSCRRPPKGGPLQTLGIWLLPLTMREVFSSKKAFLVLKNVTFVFEAAPSVSVAARRMRLAD
jgi:hypothetical protein